MFIFTDIIIDRYRVYNNLLDIFHLRLNTKCFKCERIFRGCLNIDNINKGILFIRKIFLCLK